LIEIVAVEIFSKDGPLIVASCYKPPTNNPIDRNDWTRFFAQFEGLLVIGGDFSAWPGDFTSGNHGLQPEQPKFLQKKKRKEGKKP
jgi:hypothetical protein